MSTQYSPKYFETRPEINILEDVVLNLEKQGQTISHILNKCKFKEMFPDSNIKMNRSHSARSKKSPGYFAKFSSPHNGKVVKDMNLISEDLTEITITEAITEPSESLPSVIPQPDKKQSWNTDPIDGRSRHRVNMSFPKDNFILLAPEDLYLNAIKFNKREETEKQNKIDNERFKSGDVQKAPLLFPLLSIDKNDKINSWNIKNTDESAGLIFERPLLSARWISPVNFEIDNDESDVIVDFAVPPEVILREKIANEKARNFPPNGKKTGGLLTPTERKKREKWEFIRKNLLIIDRSDDGRQIIDIDEISGWEINKKPIKKQKNEFDSVSSPSSVGGRAVGGKGIQDMRSPKKLVNKLSKSIDKTDDNDIKDNDEDEESKTILEISSPSISEQVMYHGYLINDDGIIDTKSSSRRKPFLFKKPIKTVKIVGQSEIIDSCEEGFGGIFLDDLQGKQKATVTQIHDPQSPSRSAASNVVNRNPKDYFFVGETNPSAIPIQLRNYPAILPPDLLGNVTLLTEDGHIVKRFLGVKSIDESGWAREQLGKFNIGLEQETGTKDNTGQKRTPLRLVSTATPHNLFPESNGVDRFTCEILDPTRYDLRTGGLAQNMELSRSLLKMDNQIKQMEKVSMEMEKEFAHTTQISLGTLKKQRNPKPTKSSIDNRYDNDVEDDSDKKRLKKPLIMNVGLRNEYNEDKHQQQFDLDEGTALSQTSVSYSCTDDSSEDRLQFSKQSLNQSQLRTQPKGVPRINLNMSASEDNHFDNDTLSLNSNKIAVQSHIVSSPRKSNKATSSADSKRSGNKFRNDIEKINYFRRKEEGKALALKMLNELGLPVNSSSEIAVKIPRVPSSNEMMLCEMKRNQQPTTNTSRKPMESPRAHSFQIYKPIKQKSYLNKVRLQRPEMTRENRIKNNNLIKRNQSLLSSHLQKRSIRKGDGAQTIGKQKSMLNKDPELTPRSLISQDTDMGSLFSDWSVPDNVNRMLYGGDSSKVDGRSETIGYMDDYSQIVSIQSNSVIDWDQVSEMLKSPALR